MPHRLSWLSIALAIAAWSVGTLPVAAQTNAVNGRIAFTACDSSGGVAQCDIWVMNPDGSGQTNLTNTPDLIEADPSWSPDGSRIAFVEVGDFGVINRLLVMNADGSGRTAVTPEPSYQFRPTWSPDGTKLAFVRQVPGEIISTQFDILVANIDGTGEVNLTQSDFDESDPAWSPDGSKIAFAAVRFESTVNPITGEPERGAQWEIVTINPDGSGEQILSAGDPASIRATRLEEDRAPSWSPDSSQLVFMTQSVDPCCPPWQIAAVGRDGTGLVSLSDNPEVNDLAPSYSPDGTLIVFTSDRDAATRNVAFDIYTMPAPQPDPAAFAAAAVATRLTTNGNVADPAWGRAPQSPPARVALTTTIEAVGLGAGGLVASWPPGILCGRDCSELFRTGTVVILVAVPNHSSKFAAWSGACRGSSLVCVVTMSGAKTATAKFVRRR